MPRTPPTRPGAFHPTQWEYQHPAAASSIHRQRSTHEQPDRHAHPALALNQPTPHRRQTSQTLLRKEVIQPHLPVRLPCYDFVPIAGPTFDGSSHKG